MNLGEYPTDLTNALSAYQIVKTLTANDDANNKKITAEIEALTPKVQGQGSVSGTNQNLSQQNIVPSTEQQQLNISSPSGNIPVTSPVKIPPPPTASEGAR